MANQTPLLRELRKTRPRKISVRISEDEFMKWIEYVVAKGYANMSEMIRDVVNKAIIPELEDMRR